MTNHYYYYIIKIYSYSILYYVTELVDFKSRRVADFRKNLVDLAELEIKHAQVSFFYQIYIL